MKIRLVLQEERLTFGGGHGCLDPLFYKERKQF